VKNRNAASWCFRDNAVIYRHEQVGRTLIVVLGFLALIFLTSGFLTQSLPFALIPSGIVVLACIACARLTIEVDRGGVRWGMTFRVPSGYVPFSEIASVQIVPVTFGSGIGIHLTSRGWVWNVALGRGVQIERRGLLPVVLGTDDPEALLAAIERARSSA
jgi:hypothetical protein